jgi:SNF2 family DNA or RNA helicase
VLRPVLLRRMKEDVENLPDKEEIVVWVELTAQQRQFYKAIFAKQVVSPRQLSVSCKTMGGKTQCCMC